MPSVLRTFPFSNSTSSTLSIPLTSFILSVFVVTFSALNSGAIFPLVKIVIFFAIFIKSFVSEIA